MNFKRHLLGLNGVQYTSENSEEWHHEMVYDEDYYAVDEVDDTEDDLTPG